MNNVPVNYWPIYTKCPQCTSQNLCWTHIFHGANQHSTEENYWFGKCENENCDYIESLQRNPDDYAKLLVENGTNKYSDWRWLKRHGYIAEANEYLEKVTERMTNERKL